MKSNGGRAKEGRQPRSLASSTEENINNMTSTMVINAVGVESGKMRNKIEDLL
ncbi:hypothetical protein SEA_BORDEAUX_188 [Streptomyces phage Bordeaux]|uniref:Uncharacterized protein n=1 Tax=Streptomyces phage Bordeaux TaxID=2653769 RepID=A0A5Q2WPW3_9CAUD|nr:hypothetical protein SEA_BORDEAUX_188 [Streptomyces phage Bordeaux]